MPPTLNFQHLSVDRTVDQGPNGDEAERKIAAIFLLIIVFMQIVTALTRYVQNSSGSCGRFVFCAAFFANVIHEAFIGIAVPASLVWTAYELLAGSRTIDALLAAIVGSLWYGPERVQHSVSNLVIVLKRWRILVAALGNYHRAAVEEDVDGNSLRGKPPVPITRKLRQAPRWSSSEQKEKEYWNGRVKSRNPTVLRDVQLRTIARQGVAMAFTGEFAELDLRNWCAGMVADQARFPLSKLERVGPHHNWNKVLDGFEGKLLNKSLEDHYSSWTGPQKERLATVIEGIRKKGLQYIREEKWVDGELL